MREQRYPCVEALGYHLVGFWMCPAECTRGVHQGNRVPAVDRKKAQFQFVLKSEGSLEKLGDFKDDPTEILPKEVFV